MRSRLQRIALAVVVVAGLAFAGAWQVGAVAPKLLPGNPAKGWTYSADPGTIHYTFSVRNTGRLPVTVLAAGRNTEGLRLTAVDATFPATIKQGEELWIGLTYQVTDCKKVTKSYWPVALRVERAWGTSTAYIDLPAQLPEDWKLDASVPSMLPSPRTGPTEWQRMQADVACAKAGQPLL